jgi:hypothetical protein
MIQILKGLQNYYNVIMTAQADQTPLDRQTLQTIIAKCNEGTSARLSHVLSQLQAAATDAESRLLVSDIRTELGILQSKL